MTLKSIANATPAQRKELALVDRYIELFNQAVIEQMEQNPAWRSRALLWVIDTALRELQRTLEKPKSRVRWDSPFWAFQYPVDWDWHAWREDKYRFAVQYGQLASKSLRRRKTAVRTLAKMLVRQQIYTALLDLTHHVGTFKQGNYRHPMMPEEVADRVHGLRGKSKQWEALEALFAPFSIGAAEIDFDPSKFRPGQKIPRKLAEQLRRATRAIDVPEFAFDGTIDGHAVKLRIILQVFPLVIDEGLRRVYFPITIGVMITAARPLVSHIENPPKWLDPAQWTFAERRRFWDLLLKAVQHEEKKMHPAPEGTVGREIAKVTTRLEVEMTGTSPEELQRSADRMLDTLRRKGVVSAYRVSSAPALAPGSPAAMAQTKQIAMAVLAEMERAGDGQEKGAALEKLLVALLRAVPGFEVTQNVRTSTEEIDVKVLNSHADPRWRDDAIILFECKNWSGVCGKDEVVLFERKLENRRGRAKLGFLVSWNGFAKTVSQELIRGSRAETVVGLLDGDDIRRACRAGDILPVLKAAVDRAFLN